MRPAASVLMFALPVALAPALIATSWLVVRQWGERAGGIVSALPAIAGPFLLLTAGQDGCRFAADTANATLAGLLALGAFAVAYARTAHRRGWQASLAVGWLAAGALATLVDLLAPGSPFGVLLAVGSLLMARRLIARTEFVAEDQARSSELLVSIVLAVVLICSLTLVAGALGSQVGGALAGLPVIATVLAIGTHRRRGGEAASALLRGMLEGMAGFVLFCETIVVLAVPAGIALAFSVATVVAVAAQASLLFVTTRRATGLPQLAQRQIEAIGAAA